VGRRTLSLWIGGGVFLGFEVWGLFLDGFFFSLAEKWWAFCAVLGCMVLFCICTWVYGKEGNQELGRKE